MHWIIENAWRYATPEVATVVGTLVGGFAAWKAVGWAVHGAVGLVRGFGGAALTLSGTTLLGASSIGWGIAGLSELPVLPTMAVAAGIAMLVVTMVHALSGIW